MTDYRPPNYPIVKFLVRKGLPIAVALALVPFGVGAWLGIVGQSLLHPAIGLIASIVAGGLLLSYVEVLRIISDTLIPR